jgi:AcrR family transcriptional regulator
LFATAGYDAVGTPEIAAAAGVAVGTFYRYFDDKKQVFLEIVRRYLRNAIGETLDRLTPDRFVGLARHETIEETVAIWFAYVSRQPGLGRVLLEMSFRDADVARLRAEFETAACQRLAVLIAAVCPADVVPDPEATAWVLHAAALECAWSAVSERERGLSQGPLAPVSAQRTRAALTQLIERTLFANER